MSRAIKELKGFEKINLAAGEKKVVSFKLTPEHFSFLTSAFQLEASGIRLSSSVFCLPSVI